MKEENSNDNIKIGLEIHFQIKGKKLFCSCEGGENDIVRDVIVRRLRASAGESSPVDIAALQEEKKNNEYEYLVTQNSCLVEMDEEPPHNPSEEVLYSAFIVSFILGCIPVDNLNFMRKMVIDGSNTSGFQRTGIVGINGVFYHNGKKIGISSVTLEEEACKKIEEKDSKITYSLDRLGIPLIEVSTEPDISSPSEAREVAEALGLAVKRSGFIRREVSSIRQDVNVSINSGNRVEIKGVQSLTQIQEVLEYEISRHKALNEIKEELKRRGVQKFSLNSVDITEIVKSFKSNLVLKSLSENKNAIGFRLDKLSGLLNNGKYRLGKEIAERLKIYGIGGIIHSDELPNYGINSRDVDTLKKFLKCEGEDAFGFILIQDKLKEESLKIIEDRLNQALQGVPAETRAATPDGTKFLRPLPGRSRMYPETDIPIIKISEEFLNKAKERVPSTVEERINYLVTLGISYQEATNAVWKEYDDLLEEYIKEYGNPKSVAKLLSIVFSRQERNFSKAKYILSLLKENKITKDVIEDLYVMNEDEISKFLNKQSEDIESIIKEIVDSNKDLIKNKGNESFKPLMGEIMNKLRGKVDGSKVSELLKKEIEVRINSLDH